MAETVTVACKIPAGFWLRVFKLVDFDEPLMGGGLRTVKRAQELPDRVRLNGFAHPQDSAPDQPIVGGFGLTHGVPKEFWGLWLEQNKDSDIVLNGLIFADPKPGMTEGQAREKSAVKSGLERLDPANPPKGIEWEKTKQKAA